MDDIFESLDAYESYSDYLDSRLDEQDLDYLGVITSCVELKYINA